jgi:phage repressor protein C with HTH and peptisase S24 domain
MGVLGSAAAAFGRLSVHRAFHSKAPAAVLKQGAIGGERSSSKGLSVVAARGDSMHPTILAGAIMLVDEHDRQIDDGVFAFVRGDTVRVRRFFTLIDAVRLTSDNPAYEPEVLIGEDQATLRMIGRVIWVGQRL